MAQPRINDWDQLYPGRFFKGGDIAEGEKKVVRIASVALEDLEGDNGVKAKGILTFEGEKMQLALNKTNGICLREMFGRKPYEWVGKRFAMFQSEWQQEPCIRIWGSPDIERDIDVQIDLGRRRKPFRMTMHAMRAPRAVSSGSSNVSGNVTKAEPLGERAAEVLKLMASAESIEVLQDIEANIADEAFNGRETRVLQAGFAKRRQQIVEAQAEKDKLDDLPF
jgi:hypothetical protein